MTDLLARLDIALRKQRPEYYETLLPGATTEQIDALENALQMPVPDDLRALLCWKNGHPRSEQDIGYIYTGDPLWGKYRLMSVEEMIVSLTEMREMREGDEWDNPDWWHTGYIPFAMDWGGDYLLLDTAGHLPGIPGQVVDWANAAPMRLIICDHLRDFLESVVVALESGLANPEDDGILYKAVFAERHPGYPKMHVLKSS